MNLTHLAMFSFFNGAGTAVGVVDVRMEMLDSRWATQLLDGKYGLELLDSRYGQELL